MIKYNNLQLHTEYFLSNFQKIFDLIHDTKALCLRIPETDLEDESDPVIQANFLEKLKTIKTHIDVLIESVTKNITIPN